MISGTVQKDLRGLLGAAVRARDLSLPMATSVPRALRFGPDSITDQHAKQQTVDGASRIPWEPTKPFGNRPAPRRALDPNLGRRQRGASGAQYVPAWQGLGPGARLESTSHSVVVGVEPATFPQVYVFQRRSTTTVPVTPKMRRYFAAVFEAYLRAATTSLTNHPRRFSISDAMLTRARKALLDWIVEGKAAA